MLVGSSWKNDGLDNTPHQPQRITSEATQDGNTQGKPDPAKIGAQCQTPFENLRIEPPDAEQTSTTHAESCAAADEGSRGCAACWIRCFCVGPQNRLRPTWWQWNLYRKALHRTHQDYCKFGRVGKHYLEKIHPGRPPLYSHPPQR